ncbi:MAG: tetratricopeptide repeat protein [Bdellovibrio sp.]|nr:tetratricopeptide repeat protein [Bdellovibrio sp.]
MSYFAILPLFLVFLSGCAALDNTKRQDTAALHMEIGVSYLQKENYPMALKELLVAEDLAPTNATVQSNLGLVYFLRERYDLSEKHYLKSISLKKDFTESKNNLARVYIEIDQLQKAEPLLKEALKDLTFTEYPLVNINYGVLEFKKKNYNASKVFIKKGLSIDRENCQGHLYLGRDYLDSGETSLAADQLEKAISFCQTAGTDEAHYYAALAHYRNGQRDRAIVRFEELIQLYPAGKNVEKSKKMLELIKKGNL